LTVGNQPLALAHELRTGFVRLEIQECVFESWGRAVSRGTLQILVGLWQHSLHGILDYAFVQLLIPCQPLNLGVIRFHDVPVDLLAERIIVGHVPLDFARELLKINKPFFFIIQVIHLFIDFRAI
jgi:hypothetical protein